MTAMKSTIRMASLCGAAAAALAGASVHAQDAGTGNAGSAKEPAGDAYDTSNDIVVTAQKRSESSLTVPVALTAVTAESLVKQNLTQLSDFATRVPGLSTTGPSASAISLRGVSGNAGTSPTVAVTIDDVPFGPSSWAGLGFFPDLDPSDIQQIEVLRGPQGTLYGASSLGGLIKYVTREPDTKNWSGRAEATYSNARGGTSGYGVRGAVNAPVISDVLGVRLSAYRRLDPKIIDRYSNTTGALLAENTGRNLVEGFRGAVLLRPVSGLTLNASHLEQERTYTNIGQGASTVVDPYPTSFTPKYGYFGNDNTPSVGRLKVRQTTMRGDWDFGFATLSSVSGWGTLRNYTNQDVTRNLGIVFTGIPGFAPPVYPGVPAGSVVRIDNNTLTSKFSQEVRLASSGNERIDWLFGVFYTNERSSVDQEIYAEDPSMARIGSVYINSTPTRFKEYAGFAGLTYKFSDRFDVQLGMRYSENEQSYQTQNTVVPTAVPIFGPSTLPMPRTSKDNSFTWLVTPRFRLTDDVMVFLRVASGYRPGGPNSSAAAPQPTFAPDTVINYELGMKGRFFDRKLTVDASVFSIDWKDIQLNASTIAGLPYFTNGSKARSRGLEAAVQFAPGGGWNFNGNVTVLDADLRADLPVLAPGTGNYLLGSKNDPLPYAADLTFNLGFEKSWELSTDTEFSIGANYNHVGRRDTAFRSSGAPVARRGKLEVPAYDVVDVRASLGNGVWDATLFIRNLFEERGVSAAGDNAGLSGAMTAQFIQPRTAGVTVSYSF